MLLCRIKSRCRFAGVTAEHVICDVQCGEFTAAQSIGSVLRGNSIFVVYPPQEPPWPAVLRRPTPGRVSFAARHSARGAVKKTVLVGTKIDASDCETIIRPKVILRCRDHAKARTRVLTLKPRRDGRCGAERHGASRFGMRGTRGV
jgi:hypothetical protein